METRECKHCLLRDLETDEAEMIKKYRDRIDKADRVPDDEYERRLNICLDCDKFFGATCSACGCYVELRALGIEARCPRKKW